MEFCRLLVDMSQGSHRGDSVVEDAAEEVAASGEVALLDLLEVVIPGTGARVSADGCERDPVQAQSLVVIRALVAADRHGHS